MSTGLRSEHASGRAAPPPPTPPKRRRARRWARALLVLLALLLAVRLGIAITLPWFLDRWAKPLGLSCTYERLDISLLRGRIELWHLVLEPRRASDAASTGDRKSPEAAQHIADEIAHLEYATVDVDLSALFQLAFELDRVEIDGLELHAQRGGDGRLDILRYFGSTSPTDAAQASSPSRPAAKPEGSPAHEVAAPLHLALPITIAALRLQRVRVRYEDEHVNPPIDARLDLDLSASDIGSKVRPLHVELTALSPESLGSVFVEGNCAGDDLTLHADLAVAVEVFRPETFRGYLETIGISPCAKQISFKMRAAADVAVMGERKNEARVRLALRDLVLADDLEEALGLDALDCAVDSISTQRAHVARLELSGVRAAAGRLSSGALHFAGIDILPSDDASAPPPSTSTTTGMGDAAPYPWLIDQLLVHRGAVRFQDGAVDPEADLSLELNELEIDHVTTTPAEATQPISVHAALHAPRTADNVRIDGEIAIFARQKSLNVALSADHITLAAIAPYLRAAHLASDLESGTLAFKLSGTTEESANGITRGRLELDDFRLSDADKVCAIDRIALEDILHDPTRALLRLGRVEIAGARGSVDRDRELSLHYLGLRSLPPASPAGAPEKARAKADASVHARPATPAVATTPSPRASRFEIGSLVWHDTSLHYSDHALEFPLAITFADAQAEAHELSFGGEVGDPPHAPTEIHLVLHSLGFADRVECTATIQSRPGPIDLAYSVEFKGQGIRAGEFHSYLLSQGIDSKLDGAELAIKLEGSVKSASDGIAVEFALDHAELANQGESVASIDALHVRDAHIVADAIRIGEVSIENPRAAVSRDASGALIVGGLRFIPPTPPQPGYKAPPLLLASSMQPFVDRLTAELANKNFVLDHVRTRGVDVHWQDAFVSPPVDVHALLGLKVDGFVMGKAAPPARLAVDIAVPGAVEKLELGGTLSMAPKEWSADVSVDSHGIGAGALAAYFPPGIASNLHDGSLAFRLETSWAAHDEGGARADLALHDLLYRSDDAADPLFKLGSLVLRVPRADPDARVFTIDEVSLGGMECTARRDADGNLHCLGLTFQNPRSFRTVPAPPTIFAEAQTALAAAPPGLPDAGPGFVSPSVTWQAPQALPTVKFGKLDLGIDKLTFIDETHAVGAAPLVGSFRCTSDRPTVLIDANPANLPPIHVDLHGTFERVARELDVGLDLSPWADEPTVSCRFSARGLRGEGLTELAPELAARVDGSQMTEGELAATFQAQFSLERRAPTSFDFRHSFGVNFSLENLALRDRPGGEILAGLDALSISADRIVPGAGDVHITSIDLIKPRAVLHKRPDGVHMLGLIVKPGPAAPAAAAVAPPSTAQTSIPSPPSPAPPAPSHPPIEVRVDQFSVSGIDVDFRDDSVTPPIVMPLVDLELTVNRFSSLMFEEPIPLRFSAFLVVGEVALPERERERGSWISNITELPGVSTLADLVPKTGRAGKETARPAFEELSVSGVMAVSPSLSGSVTTDLRGMELLNFAGLAQASKITINDGILDAHVKLDIDPGLGASVQSIFRFSHLSLSEEMGGPIQRFLLLPAPLDQVLFVLRDANGDQVVPLAFEVKGANVSRSQITRAAVSTFSQLATKAIADAPLRVLSWIGRLFGIGTGERAKLEKETRTFRFDPGEAGLSRAAVHEIEPLIELLKSESDTMLVVRQQLGTGDVARAEVLANPTPDECLEIVARLRQERDELLRKSDELQSRASALWSVGREDMASDASDRLRSVARQVGDTERTLDRLLDLVRPGAERFRDRRTSQACRVIGAQRIASLRELFTRRGVKDVDARIEVRSLRPEPTAGEGGGQITLVPVLRTSP